MKALFSILFILCFSWCAFSQVQLGRFYRNDKEGGGVLTITKNLQNKNLLNVSLTCYGTPQFPCYGEFIKKFKIINSNFAEYKVDNANTEGVESEAISCRMFFTFSQNQVTVRDTDCSYYHGAACWFAGDYKKPARIRKRGK